MGFFFLVRGALRIVLKPGWQLMPLQLEVQEKYFNFLWTANKSFYPNISIHQNFPQIRFSNLNKFFVDINFSNRFVLQVFFSIGNIPKDTFEFKTEQKTSSVFKNAFHQKKEYVNFWLPFFKILKWKVIFPHPTVGNRLFSTRDIFYNLPISVNCTSGGTTWIILHDFNMLVNSPWSRIQICRLLIISVGIKLCSSFTCSVSSLLF